MTNIMYFLLYKVKNDDTLWVTKICEDYIKLKTFIYGIESLDEQYFITKKTYTDDIFLEKLEKFENFKQFKRFKQNTSYKLIYKTKLVN